MEHRHGTIDGAPPCGCLCVCQPAEITGNERPEFIIGGMDAEKFPVADWEGAPLVGGLFRRPKRDPFWFKNPGWEWTRIAVSDIDDRAPEFFVPAEAETPLLHCGMERLGWFDPLDRTPHVLHDYFYCPYTVHLADFDRNGHLDVPPTEMGNGGNDNPEQVVFRNRGGADFESTVVEGDSCVDIVGKSYEPEVRVDVWQNRT